MGQEFVHLSPVILTDDMFFSYNPDCVVTGTAALRDAAYLEAEQRMITHINTPLLPTQISGTYLWPRPPSEPFLLDYVRVRSVDSIVARTLDDACECDLSDNEACAIIREGKFGILDIRQIDAGFHRACGGCGPGCAYQVDLTYTAGLQTGVAANDKTLHAALAFAARISLNEMVDPGANEGGAGDPGVQGWASQGYSENRTTLRRTVFGSSARANRIADMVEHLRIPLPLKFG
jgi:hypothetical protein